MFRHLLRYRLKIFMQNGSIIFWTLLFPIILAIFCQMTMVNLDRFETFQQIPVGVVKNTTIKKEPDFTDLLTTAKQAEKNLFEVTTYTLPQAEVALEDNQISGYFRLEEDNPPSLSINQNGFNQTLLEMFLQQYLTQETTYKTLLTVQPPLTQNELAQALEIPLDYTEIQTLSENPPQKSSLYFFAVIAMACMFGMNWGIKNANDTRANHSATGIRLGVQPVNQALLVLTNLIASIIIFFSEILIILLFMTIVLEVDFGNRWPEIIFTCLLACLLSLSLGSLIGNSIHGNYNLINAIVSMISVFGAFLSGMMFPEIKYWIAQNLPLLSWLNPTNLVTDSFYQLYYYTDLSGFYLNLSIMALMLVLVNLVNYFITRRKTYVSL